MADKVYEIEFRTTLDNAGAAGLEKEIKSVSTAVDDLNQKTAAKKGIDELRQRMEQGKQRAGELAEELKKTSGNAADLGRNTASAAGSLNSMNGAIRAFQSASKIAAASGSGLASSFAMIGQSLRAITGGPLGLFLIGLQAVIAVVRGARDASKSLQETLDSFNPAADAAAKALEKVATVKLDMKVQRDAITAIKDEMEKARSSADAMRAEIEKLEAQKVKTEVAKINEREAADIAAAGGDQGTINAIKARADQERAALETSAESSRIDRDIAATREAILAAEEMQFEMTLRANTAAARYEAAMSSIADLAETLGLSMSETQRLRSDPARLEADIKEAESFNDPARAANLRSMQSAFGIADEAGKTKSMAETELANQTQRKNLLDVNAQRLSLEKEATQANTGTQAIELGTASISALQGLKHAIDKQRGVVDAARSGVAQAQATGGGAQQNAAYAGLQAAEAELARLQGLANQAATTVDQGAKAFGDSFLVGAQGVAQKATAAAAGVGASAGVAIAAVETAAGDLVATTAGAAEGMTQAIGGLAKSVEQVAAAAEQRIEQLAYRLQRAESSIAETRNLEGDIVREIKTLQSQVRNTR